MAKPVSRNVCLQSLWCHKVGFSQSPWRAHGSCLSWAETRKGRKPMGLAHGSVLIPKGCVWFRQRATLFFWGLVTSLIKWMNEPSLEGFYRIQMKYMQNTWLRVWHAACAKKRPMLLLCGNCVCMRPWKKWCEQGPLEVTLAISHGENLPVCG